MTPEQKAAYIMSQVACAQAQIAYMQAHNEADKQAGRSLRFNPSDFEDVPNNFHIHHNAVVGKRLTYAGLIA